MHKTNPLGVSVQPEEGSGDHFWDMGFTLQNFGIPLSKILWQKFYLVSPISQKSSPDPSLGQMETPNGLFLCVFWAPSQGLSRCWLVCGSQFWKSVVSKKSTQAIMEGVHGPVAGELEYDRWLKTMLRIFHWGFPFNISESYKQYFEIHKHFYKNNENHKTRGGGKMRENQKPKNAQKCAKMRKKCAKNARKMRKNLEKIFMTENFFCAP